MPPGLEPGTPDVAALRRRVLGAGLLSLVLLVAAAGVLTALGAPDWTVLAVAVVLWLLVVRPLLRPVRRAVALRRRLAFQAFRDARAEEDA